MTDKEIYKARADGFNLIDKSRKPVSDLQFMEFMSCVKEIAEQYKTRPKSVEDKIMEKCEIRKKLIKIFRNDII